MVTAQYVSDGPFASGTAQLAGNFVVSTTTTTTVSTSAPSVQYGQAVTLTATVFNETLGSGTPAGMVDFTDQTTGGDLTPGGVALVNGTASVTPSNVSVGTHEIIATFLGSTGYICSTSVPQSVVVTIVRAATTTAVTTSGVVTEYALSYPTGTTASTHEIAANPSEPGVYMVTSPAHDAIVRFDSATGQATYFSTPAGSMPHALVFDDQGRFWMGFEGFDQIAQVDPDTGAILKTVQLPAMNGAPIGPHALALGADGRTIWFVNQASGTVGAYVRTRRRSTSYSLSAGSLTDLHRWPGPGVQQPSGALNTSLATKIFRVTPSGAVTEVPHPRPTVGPLPSSRAADGQPYLWFSEENSDKVARISVTGQIAEFTVPTS